jgi:formamidopyrimidine-DNA glycosylase
VPELPEVETVVCDLRHRLVGRRLLRVHAGPKPLRRPWRPEWGKLLLERRVRGVSRRGKWILILLDGGVHLVCHLGMTGQLTVVPAKLPRPPHTHLVFDLDRGRSQLRFRDVRRFGSMTLFADAEAVELFFAGSGLGPEPFALDAASWHERLTATERCLKAVLLDQRVVAGVGNIYADEALFEARLHPTRLGSSLSAIETRRLLRAIVKVLRRAIERRGSSIRDYVGGNGERGGFQQEFKVYGRTGEACPRCRSPITRMVLAGRSTHHCPSCQVKEPANTRPRRGRG